MRETGKQTLILRRERVRNIVRASLVALVASVLLMTVSVARAQDDSKVRPTSSTFPTNSSSTTTSQPPREYPKEIRGYKLARARVEVKRTQREAGSDADTAPDTDALIQFGEPRIVRTTPLGITLEVPVTVAAVKQGGTVHFLTFEDMMVNGMPVTVEDYLHEFELPNKSAVALPRPIRVYINTSRALVGAINEWSNPKETWPVTGRVYVFGRFKKFIFNFKRVIPVELSLALPNPLRNKDANQKISDPAIKQ